ncbi:kinesin-domain-containing protein [Lizonia empirigonia]|nr:kinesin-domain-containing protein [Lizonia empirigonia]
MSGPLRSGPPSVRASSMRPPHSRQRLSTTRSRSALPALDEHVSLATSVASSQVRSSPQSRKKRKERDFEHDGDETNINVVVRCRGRNDREVRENSGVVVFTDGTKGRTIDLSMGPTALSNKTYQFDKVFSPAADQTMVFDEVVMPILDEVLSGFNCTIFAYGQTGTGKTHTMSGDISNILPLPDSAGIIPRVLYSLFNKLELEGTENSVKCSFIELYNEELRDLLSTDDNVKLKIFDDNKKGHSSTLVQGMEECHLKSATQGIQLLSEGSHKRQVAATKCNDLSSRSHTVFTITVHMKRTTEDGQEYMSGGKLNLVDLAGSENIQRSGAENKRAAEAGLINKSLLTLGRVINSLVERSSHVPYRESKLTRLLQDSLGGHTKTCIIATVSPAKSNLEETISTLDYAFRAKNIRNQPQVNQLLSKKTLLKEFTTEIEKLKTELRATRQRNGIYLSQENYDEICTISESRKVLSEEQRDKIETMEMNLRNKLEELFSLTTSFQSLKKDSEQTKLTLETTKGILEKTGEVLEHTQQSLTEEATLRKAHEKTEGDLVGIGYDMISTLEKATSDIDGLRSKIQRKSRLQSQNRQHWVSSQNRVLDTTLLVEMRIERFQTQQRKMMENLSARMQAFVKNELERLDFSQLFLQEKMKAFESSEREVNEHTVKAHDDLNEVLEEIKTLREGVKKTVGEGLNELSVAAEEISANISTELKSFHMQNTFTDLLKSLDEQQAENDRLHRRILEANTSLIEANKTSQSRLVQLIDEETQKSTEERLLLLNQVTSLINASADDQEKRLRDRISNIGAEIGVSTAAHEVEQVTYNESMNAWRIRSKDTVVGVTESRERVKSRIKSGFATATQNSTSIKDSTASLLASTVNMVEAQMIHMDTQLESLDDVVSRVRAQNNEHHAAHTSSLSALSSAVASSYSSIGDHLSTSFVRIQSLDADMSAQATALKNALPALSPDGTIRAPLHELRDAISNQSLAEYNPTGETPERFAYPVPSNLPQTETHDLILSRIRNRNRATSDAACSPSKVTVFSDNITSTSPTLAEDLFASTRVKPNFLRSISANAAPSAGTMSDSFLCEQDINILSQTQSQDSISFLKTQSLDLDSPTDNVGAAPPRKKQNRGGEKQGNAKLLKKKIGPKTIGMIVDTDHGAGDKENLTNVADNVQLGIMVGRNLRSSGSHGARL